MNCLRLDEFAGAIQRGEVDAADRVVALSTAEGLYVALATNRADLLGHSSIVMGLDRIGLDAITSLILSTRRG